MRFGGVLVAAALGLASSFDAVQISEERVYTRMCDASAGIALSTNIFVAADDESNQLRTYARSRPGVPVSQLELGGFLMIGKGAPEIDTEGAAQVGDTVYWITSHGRNRDGEIRPSRQRFFATKINTNGEPRLEVSGRPYANLLRDLIAEPQFSGFELEEAAGKAPKKKNALNIEGLCARPDGTLLIAFRNPVPKKKALLIPLLNPAELARGGNVRAKFGAAIQLDLQGNGIRDMVQQDGKFYMIAGARDGGHEFQLYKWDGKGAPELLHQWEARTFNPEAILSVPGRAGEFLILSDDGSLKTAGTPCKDFPEASRRFRSVLLKTE
jgi:hypothetical protein